VLYDHWYSWQLRYYLFDIRVYVNWFATPDSLATDLTVFGDSESHRFIAVLSSETALPVLRAVNNAGFSYELVNSLKTTGLTDVIRLYQITPQ